MNTMTYTIESVHGVKQTFILGILDRSVSDQPVKDKPGQMPTPPDGGATQAPPQLNR